MHRFCKIAALSAVLLVATGAAANATTYFESTQGDLSDDPGMPTKLGPLTLGDNYVTGSSNPSGDAIPNGHGALAVQDNDFFTFTVAAGTVLSQFDLVGGTSISGDDRFFLGVYSGQSTLVDPTNPTPAGLLGYTLPGQPQIGTNILPGIEAADEPGFPTLPTHLSGPLGAGNYTVWLVDGDRPLSYVLDLNVASVPEPATWSLMIGGLGLMGARLRQRSQRAIPTATS